VGRTTPSDRPALRNVGAAAVRPRLARTDAPALFADNLQRMRTFAAVVLAAASLAWMSTWSLPAGAQSASASYQVPRQSIDGGAARTTSASFTLQGTVGQPDAGAVMSSASHALRGGFHMAAPSGPRPVTIFRDGFEAP